jgi:hypothetical protein
MARLHAHLVEILADLPSGAFLCFLFFVLEAC